MTLIAGLEPQPEFPYTDMTDGNAALLELMLANQNFVTNGHQISERTSLVFRVGHLAIVRGIGRLQEDDKRLSAIDHGVALFEATAALLISRIPKMDYTTVNTNGVAIAEAMDIQDLQDYADTALYNMTENLPLSSRVFESASRRFYPSLTSYALLGAAMARQFEIDAV